jgi:hypothetical protein
MKVRLANTRGMQAAESMLQLTPLAYTHTPLMQLRNHKEGFMKGFMERVKMEFSNRK